MEVAWQFRYCFLLIVWDIPSQLIYLVDSIDLLIKFEWGRPLIAIHELYMWLMLLDSADKILLLFQELLFGISSLFPCSFDMICICSFLIKILLSDAASSQIRSNLGDFSLQLGILDLTWIVILWGFLLRLSSLSRGSKLKDAFRVGPNLGEVLVVKAWVTHGDTLIDETITS